jgi:sigma-B regulation protein RsbU (phosphoserine phosphatase)
LLTKINELKNPTLKTVMVSAYGDMDNIRTAMNRGAFDFTTKPIDFTDLEITINKTIEHVSLLQKAEIEHHQLTAIQHDLSIAKEIQQSILPKNFPAFPEHNEFDVYAQMEAAKSVGGDFYDFFMIDNTHLGLVIADVSDKGIPAAIYMAVSRTIIRAAALKGLSPDECMNYSNELLCKENINDMFVTTFYCILEINTGKLSYCNAGHNPPYIVHSEGNIERLKLTGNTVLGVLEGLTYNTFETELKAGDSLFLYTDGVTESMDVQNNLFGDNALEELLAKCTKFSPMEIISEVRAALDAHAQGAIQSDDITMLSVKFA